MLKQYLQIVKPGIIVANLISMIGGFLLATKAIISYDLLLFSSIGVLLIIASSCIFNNYIDRDIDRKMERTKNRILVKNLIHPLLALSCATLLGSTGFIFLWFKINPLTCWLGIIGFLIYVVLYSLYMKRYSIYSTLIGSLSGAIPPVIGYAAVTKDLDSGALILFTIFSLWQIPHFYAIAILHFKDYQASSIPVLPVIKGISLTKKYIICYIIAYIVSTLLPFLKGYTSYKYLLVVLITGLWWFCIALHGYRLSNNIDHTIWAKKIFIFSVIAITSVSIMMSLDFII